MKGRSAPSHAAAVAISARFGKNFPMLVPQFTTRRLFALIAVCSVLFLVLSMAVQGQLWAVATSIDLGALVITFLTFAILFQAAYVMSKLIGFAKPEERPQSPFAKDTAPPVIVRPTSQE